MEEETAFDRFVTRFGGFLAVWVIAAALALPLRGCLTPAELRESDSTREVGTIVDSAREGAPVRACFVALRANQRVICLPSLGECNRAREGCPPWECSPCCVGECVTSP